MVKGLGLWLLSPLNNAKFLPKRVNIHTKIIGGAWESVGSVWCGWGGDGGVGFIKGWGCYSQGVRVVG